MRLPLLALLTTLAFAAAPLLAGEPAPRDPWADNPATPGTTVIPPPPAPAQNKKEPKPPATERISGQLSGAIENIDLVKKIVAIDRSLEQAFIQNTVKSIEIEGLLDRDKKTYSFPALPEGAYDLKLELTDGRIIEGCDLRPEKPSVDPLTHADRQKIRTAFANMRQFTDENTIWRIEGNGQFTTVLLELVRHEKTSLNEKVDGDDFVIWRVELWQYTKRGEVWEHTHSQVLQRIRPSVKTFETWNKEFSPAFSAIAITGHRMTFKDLVAPKTSDVTSGRFTKTYTAQHRQDGPRLHAGVLCKIILVDPETGTIVLDAGTADNVTTGMEAWVYDAQGTTVIAKGPVLRVAAGQTTAQIPGLKARLPEVDPDDPFDKQGQPKLPEALKSLKEGTQVRLVPLSD